MMNENMTQSEVISKPRKLRLEDLSKSLSPPGVFGQRLEETVLYERRYGVRLVPLVVEQCVTFILERGLHEVGLFRQPGRTSLVKELQEAFDSGERPSFDSGTDVHTVASLLKLYLRQLPEPLVPYCHYQDFLLCGQKLSKDRTLGLLELRNLLHELPVANFNLLDFICQFLNEVQRYSSSNKMTVQNLATVFGPNILRAKAEDPQSIMGGAALVQVLMLELIREHESLFAKAPPPVYARPPRSLNASPLKQAHLQPSACLRQLSLPLIADHSTEPEPAAHADDPSSALSAAGTSDLSSVQKRHLGHRYTSSHPGICFSPLPFSHDSIQHHTDRPKGDHYHGPTPPPASTASLQPQQDSSQAATLTGGTKARPHLEKTALAFWSCRGAEKAGLVPETASGGSSDAQEDSTLSPYDNLHQASERQAVKELPAGRFDSNAAGSHRESCESEAEHAGESSSSWSSCEVLPLDEGGDDVGAVSLENPTETPERLPSSQKVEQENNDEDNRDNKHHPNSWASCSVLSVSPLSTGSSEVFLPSGPPEVQGPESFLETRNNHPLVAKMRQQMTQQKAEYQRRIERLERCNDVLERQVAVLRLSLEQHRRSQSVAEIKIQNMERAKADADRRNTNLQKEMELFFRMHREIRKRGGTSAGGGGSI
ncbi:rho GTPase-activating protein 24 [Kryptolebias marmoratus]|uniref:rho GTPase-activating protein 24 n=1 Tax=Kryptolebias marmoratus TaxID=37003 RepID=UPI0018ACA1BF|nr:rho GTPase-activating protein 24 [Kryptolebias marmoratus]